MYSTFELWLTGIVGLAIGGAIGYFAPRYLQRQSPNGSATEAELQALRASHESYRHDVAAHFSKTAQLLEQLIGDYRDVHNHLAHGAETLCEDQPVTALKRLPDDRLAEQQVPTLVEAPRDYAPKIAQGSKNILDEDFGIEKIKRAAIPEPPRY